MAGRAGTRRRLIEQDFITLDELNLLMALRTGNVLVSALQREHRLLVIEQRWPPLRRVVARRAPCRTRLGKLTAVGVSMAVLALLRRLAEVDVLQREFHVGRPVTIRASSRPVSARQNEVCRRMIECGYIRPFLRRVTHFTATSACRHALRKLAAMRIRVARRTRQVSEMVRSGFSRFRALMTIAASHCRMPAC